MRRPPAAHPITTGVVGTTSASARVTTGNPSQLNSTAAARTDARRESLRKNYYVSESVGIACGFFIAALHRMGLATLTHTPNPMAFLSKVLDRPRTERPYIIFPVGYPAADCEVPLLDRKPLGEALLVRRAR